MNQKTIRALRQIPGVGISTAKILQDIGINSVDDLKGKTPEALLEQANEFYGKEQDRCLLYVIRCAVYYANTEPKDREVDKLLWWNWKNEDDCDNCSLKQTQCDFN